MKLKVDINCDLGESYGAFRVGNDAKIMPCITSANIACGFHAGDPVTISRTMMLAKQSDVAVGCHPALPDIIGFGRREMQLSDEEARTYVVYQIGALAAFAKIAKTKLQHVKPHGALYNKAAQDLRLAKSIIKAVKDFDEELIVFAPPRSKLAEAAENTGLRVAFEVFADRAYNSDGNLLSRSKKGAIINDPEVVVERAVGMVKDRSVLAVDGKEVDFGDVHTICVHGDTLGAVELASSLKKGLTKAGITVEPAGKFL
jgi:UPF0271 protein